MNLHDAIKQAEAALDRLHTEAMEDRSDCRECRHAHFWDECHPYGSTTACEELFECRADRAGDCPWVEQVVARMHHEVNAVTKGGK